MRSYNNFISIFTYLITGNFEVSFDNDSYFTGESKYHIGEAKPILSGNFTNGGDDAKGSGYIGPTPGNSFKLADNTVHYKALDGNHLDGGDGGSQDPLDNCMAQVLRAQKKYVCENEDCTQLNISFFSQEDLDAHVKRTHHCVKPECSFCHMNSEILYNHTLSHRLNNVDY